MLSLKTETKRLFFITILLFCVHGFFDALILVSLPKIFAQLDMSFIPTNSKDKNISYHEVYFFIGYVVAGYSLGILISYLIPKLCGIFLADLSDYTFHSIGAAGLPYLNSVGDHIIVRNLFPEVQRVSSVFAVYIRLIYKTITLCALGFVFINLLNSDTLIIMTFLVAIFGLVFLMFYPSLKSRGSEISHINASRLKTVESLVSNFQEILVRSAFKTVKRTFYFDTLKLGNIQAYIQFISSIPKQLMEMLGLISLAVFILIQQNDPLDTNVSTESLGIASVIMIGLYKLIPILNTFYVGASKIGSDRAALKSLKTLQNYRSKMPISIDQESSPDHYQIKYIDISRFEIRHTGNSEEQITFKLSIDPMRIKKGDIVTIQGPSGSGKSTFLTALIGLNRSSFDHIKYITSSNQTITDSPYHFGIISIVPQTSFVISGTIKDNLLFGIGVSETEVTDQMMLRALDLLQFQRETHDTRIDLLNSEVGSNGDLLSGGQKQRLVLARAFLQNSEILILDEATSGMDSTLEVTVLQNLLKHRRDKITILTSHNNSSLNFCNKIISIADGVASIKDYKPKGKA